jgi:Ni/Fe-hydrogenase subunit HybB-like protein
MMIPDRTRTIKDILWIFALSGLVAMIMRLWFGLGATTNLSDAMPWGLWKILNMVAGVALSTSGFTVGFLVYVLNIERFRPYMKPAILVAFLGYGCSCAALLFDIGLPYRFWHPIFMWNFNSFLFEVFWCVLLYFTVTAIELAPTFLKRMRADRVVRLLHKVAFGVVVIGISLSSLHHSSLGSLFLVTPLRLHSLWYSPWLPLFFILSAMGAGIMVVVLLRILYAFWYDPDPIFGAVRDRSAALIRSVTGTCVHGAEKSPAGPELARVRRLAMIGAGILAVYAALKIIDLFVHNGWGALLAGSWESWLYIFELVIAAILPAALVLSSVTRRSPKVLGLAAFLAAAGLALNRLDVGIFGYFSDAQTVYFPSLTEWLLGIGVVAAAGLVFFAVVEHFPVFSDLWPASTARPRLTRHPFGTARQLWHSALTDSLHRISLLAVFVLPIAFIMLYPPYRDNAYGEMEVQPAIGLDIDRAHLRIDANRAGLVTDFAHAEHQKRLKDSSSCVQCHHLSMPLDKSTPCSRCHRQFIASVSIFDHTYHMKAIVRRDSLEGWYPVNYSCSTCHQPGRPKTSANVKDCRECHKDDMVPPQFREEEINLHFASSFVHSMHETCIPCHRKEQECSNDPGRKNLGRCWTCHPSLRPRDIDIGDIAFSSSHAQFSGRPGQ